MKHPGIKNELISFACETVARALGWDDLHTFERIELPEPCLFVLRSGAGRTVLVMQEDPRDGGGVIVRGADHERSLRCERRVSIAALRAIRGDFGETASIGAGERFKRLRDVDLAESR